MTSNGLKLKTELIWLSTRQPLVEICSHPVTVGGKNVAPVQSVRDLGVFLDDQLTMNIFYPRIVVRSGFYQLRKLCSVLR